MEIVQSFYKLSTWFPLLTSYISMLHLLQLTSIDTLLKPSKIKVHTLFLFPQFSPNAFFSVPVLHVTFSRDVFS